MKRLSLLLIIVSFLSFSKDDESKHFFHFYEPSLNLIYMSIDTEVTFELNQKTQTTKIANNLAIYDIQKDSTSYLFEKSFSEEIAKVLFEVSFVDSTESIEYNYEVDYSSFNFINNHNLPKRTVSDNLLVETLNKNTKTRTLWIAHKSGKNLTKAFSMKATDAYFIDSQGKAIIVMERKNGSITVSKAKF